MWLDNSQIIFKLLYEALKCNETILKVLPVNRSNPYVRDAGGSDRRSAGKEANSSNSANNLGINLKKNLLLEMAGTFPEKNRRTIDKRMTKCSII